MMLMLASVADVHTHPHYCCHILTDCLWLMPSPYEYMGLVKQGSAAICRCGGAVPVHLWRAWDR